MEDQAQLLARRKAELGHLLSEMDRLDDKAALHLLDEYVKGHEASLYQEIGRLTRQVHDVLASFQMDRRILELAENEIPDAKDRLAYVITVTEQAAQKVIDAIESSLPMAADMQINAERLLDKWKTFSRREMNVEEFRVLCRENDAFLHGTHADADRLKGHLNDMLMAQEFQDLTGQVIRRVIQLVRDVEDHLVELVKMTGGKRETAAPAKVEAESSHGPAVPGVDDHNHNRVANQDDVDDLLSSLGF